MQIKDIFFIKTILDRATAGSHNGETGYYSVSDNMFSEGHSCYCDNGNDYYSDLKGIFDCDSTLPSFGSYNQTMFDAGQLPMTIVKMAANNYLSILVGGQNVSLNFDGNYYYTQNYYSCYGGTWWRWDYINGELTNYKMYTGGSYATIDENVETTLYSSMPIKMYYSGADRDINYARIAGDQGVGSGGWQVPNPNPTRKIVLNGVNYSDANPEDPNYNWYYNDDKTLIVRESKADSSFRWYFNDFAVTASSSPFQTLPSNLQPFIKNGVGVECSVRSGEQSVGYIGFHDNTIRLWHTGWGSNFTGICKGIMESTDTSGASHTWEEPNIPTVKIIKLNGVTPKKIMLNGVCYYERQGASYLYNWDLTSSTVDPVTSTELQYYLNDSSDTTANVATKSGLYTSGTGVTFSDQNDVNGIVLPVNLYTPGNVLEVDFTNFQVTYTMMEWGQTMVETHKCQGSYDTDYGIHWGVGGDYSNWFLTSNYDLGSGNTSYGYCDITNSTQAQLFANSTLKIKVVSSANNRTQWEIYKDDTLLVTTPELNNSSTYPFMLASASDTDNLFMLSPNYLNATVTGIRIYQE